MRWNFGDSRSTSLSLDEFLAQKEAAGVEFFAGKEPWLVGIHKLSRQTFFRVCTQDMDDLSQKAIKLVIEYCPVSHSKTKNLSSWMRAERSCAELILVEVSVHEKISCGSSDSFGVLRRRTGPCRDWLWNSVAIPISCLDSFKPLRPRTPRQLRSPRSGFECK